ncbi:LysE/ArgO family amino acid transporter [Halomonas sp. V046]|uniref:LysE/ArgO family amino acid transporter n=1 Tax=Halomonas sp. V046 TaxID=3459611 RepID=UPI004043CF4C
MWVSLFHGLGTGAGLIVAIGAQNAFVLSKGLRGEHPWRVALVCALCDAVLIGLGVLGLGALIAAHDTAMNIARYGGAAFLVWQALLALKRVLRPQGLAAMKEAAPSSRSRVLVTTLAVTLLNPQVYLDTLVMLGAIGSLQPEPLGFYAGATMASFAWFFALVGAAGWLAPRLASPNAWRAVDLTICIIMLLVAWQLLSLEVTH